MAKPCLSKQTQRVQEESVQNLAKQVLHLVVGGQPDLLPLFTRLLWLVLRQGLTLAQAGLRLGDLLASAF